MNFSPARACAQYLFIWLGLIVISASLRGSIVAAADRSPGAFAETAAIQGRVRISGAQQRLKPLPVFKSRAFCGAMVRNETLLIGADGGVENAVVLLRPLGRKTAVEPEAITLDNKQCAFTPHVQIARVGSELLLKNSDPILHTVHARMGHETLFNVGLPKWRRVTQRLDRAGVIRINCDVLHTWMSAAIVVTDTPYFALTDKSGHFKLEHLPAGEYDIEVWHERLGARQQQLALSANGITHVEVIYAQEKPH
jgi:plastocyanin